MNPITEHLLIAGKEDIAKKKFKKLMNTVMLRGKGRDKNKMSFLISNVYSTVKKFGYTKNKGFARLMVFDDDDSPKRKTDVQLPKKVMMALKKDGWKPSRIQHKKIKDFKYYEFSMTRNEYTIIITGHFRDKENPYDFPTSWQYLTLKG